MTATRSARTITTVAAAICLCQLVLPAFLAAQVESLRTMGSVAEVSARNDSLARIAMTSPDPAARAAAVSHIAQAGTIWFMVDPHAPAPPSEPAYPGVVQHLVRVYRQSDNAALREGIIRWMPLQSERAQAVAFLEQVAQEVAPPPPAKGMAVARDDFTLAEQALIALRRMGPEGQAALERLRAKKKPDQSRPEGRARPRTAP